MPKTLAPSGMEWEPRAVFYGDHQTLMEIPGVLEVELSVQPGWVRMVLDNGTVSHMRIPEGCDVIEWQPEGTLRAQRQEK